MLFVNLLTYTIEFKMKSILSAIALIVSPLLSLHAQTTELTGTIIGTPISVDYSTNNPSETVNTIANVFDNDLSTFFASYDRSYTWVGLDLGEKHVITKIAYASRPGSADRMQLGVFEGANNPDFTDAVPLYMIKDIPQDNVLTTKYPRTSRGFRYVRYVGPNNVRCNVAELKFYGYKGEGNDSRFYSPTNLPLVVIHTDSAKQITSRTVYTPGIISIVSDEGKEIYADSLEIRGRGNGSWGFPKKPYKLKLAHKKKLLGMPAKAKKWTLINNYGDKTLVRNLLAFKISELMGMEYTPAGRLVEVMFNGEYQGVYQLCDQIEVKKNRVDITEMTPEDNSGSELTGGYLIEIDAYASGEKKWFTSKDFELPVSLKYPDEDDITPQQENYITTYFNRMASRVANPLYADPKLGFRRYLDEDSFLKRFLIEELAANVDAWWSVHMYKDRDSTKFYTGPVWDFDLAFENDIRIHPVSGFDDFIFLNENTTSAGNMREFVKRVIGVESDRLKKLWSTARNENGLTIENLNLFLDSMQTEVYEAQKLNFTRWPVMNQIVNQNYQVTGSYEGEMKVVRDFLTWRIPWLDNKVGLIPVGIEQTVAGKTEIRSVEGGIGISGKMSVEVYDMSGIVVAKTDAAATETVIPLAKGLYIVRATDGKTTIRRKIMVR